MPQIQSIEQLKPYGNIRDRTIVAYCKSCGYRRKHELRLDHRGLARCLTCGNPVRAQPSPSRMNYDKKRTQRRAN